MGSPVKPPRTVTIGRYVYAVKTDGNTWTKYVNSDQIGGNGFGCTNHHDAIISLNPETTTMQMVDTLLHEVLHCVWFISGIAVDHLAELKFSQVEEHLVNRLTPWLALVIANNPKLMAYLANPETVNGK